MHSTHDSAEHGSIDATDWQSSDIRHVNTRPSRDALSAWMSPAPIPTRPSTWMSQHRIEPRRRRQQRAPRNDANSRPHQRAPRNALPAPTGAAQCIARTNQRDPRVPSTPRAQTRKGKDMSHTNGTPRSEARGTGRAAFLGSGLSLSRPWASEGPPGARPHRAPLDSERWRGACRVIVDGVKLLESHKRRRRPRPIYRRRRPRVFAAR